MIYQEEFFNSENNICFVPFLFTEAPPLCKEFSEWHCFKRTFPKYAATVKPYKLNRGIEVALVMILMSQNHELRPKKSTPTVSD